MQNSFQAPKSSIKDLFVAAGIILASLAFVMELAMFPMLLPEIGRDLKLEVQKLSWTFNIYSFAVAVSVVLSGLLGDRLDKRRLFAIGVLMFVVGSIMCGLSKGLWDHLIWRAVQGMGGGLFSPLVPVLLSRAFPKKPGKVLVVWGGVAGVVATALPVVADILLSVVSWRAIFFCIAAVSSLSLIISWGPLQREIDIDRYSVGNRWLLFVNTRVISVLLYIFLTYGCFALFLFCTPVWMASFGYTSRDVAMALALVWMSFTFTNFLMRNHLDGQKMKVILLSAPLLLGAGLLSFSFYIDSWTGLLSSAVLIGAGFATSNAPSTHLVLKLAPKESHSLAASMDIICARLGGVIAVGLLAAATPSVAGISGGAIAIVAFLSCCYGVRQRPFEPMAHHLSK